MKRAFVGSVVLGLLLFHPVAVRADTIALGTLSFDVFIPAGPGISGVNTFNLSDLTGSFDLPLGFPAASSLIFGAATLNLTFSDSSTLTVLLGDISPGPLLDSMGNPLAALQFPDSANFASALFTATLNTTTITLFNGTNFSASSPSISFVLLPSAGSTLVAGTDAGVMTVSGTVPEPNAIILLGTALLAVIALNSRSSRNAS